MHQVLNDCAVSQTTCEMSHVLKLFWTLFGYVMAHEMYEFPPVFVLQVMKSWAGSQNERLQDTISFREIKTAVGALLVITSTGVFPPDQLPHEVNSM